MLTSPEIVEALSWAAGFLIFVACVAPFVQRR